MSSSFQTIHRCDSPTLLGVSPFESRRWTGGIDPRICQTFAASPAEPGELPFWFRRSETYEKTAAGRNVPPRTQHHRALRIIAHIGMARRQTWTPLGIGIIAAARPQTLASIVTVAAGVAGSTAPVTRIPASATRSQIPFQSRRERAGQPASVLPRPVPPQGWRLLQTPHSCRRHPYSWLGWLPASRATAETPVVERIGRFATPAMS